MRFFKICNYFEVFQLYGSLFFSITIRLTLQNIHHYIIFSICTIYLFFWLPLLLSFIVWKNYYSRYSIDKRGFVFFLQLFSLRLQCAKIFLKLFFHIYIIRMVKGFGYNILEYLYLIYILNSRMKQRNLNIVILCLYRTRALRITLITKNL